MISAGSGSGPEWGIRMQEILIMVQRVTVFILISTLLTDLFSGTEYKKYLQYAVSLIVIVLVISPFFRLLDKGIDLQQWKELTVQEGTVYEDGRD